LGITIVVLSVAILLSPTRPAESGAAGSVCISPVHEKPTNTSAPGFFCDSTKLTVKIDEQRPMAWPIRENVKIEALDVTATHRVVVFCNGKPQQSFKFHFSEFKTRELCLFINDMYKTAQLWDEERAPWCKCKKS
jgi:hypothetical protein